MKLHVLYRRFKQKPLHVKRNILILNKKNKKLYVENYTEKCQVFILKLHVNNKLTICFDLNANM